MVRIIDAEVRSGAYDPPIEVDTLAYATVRLVEAFHYNDAVVGISSEIHRLRPVLAAMFGVDRAPQR